MPLSEFELIEKYFTELCENPVWLEKGIGDDAAVINTIDHNQLLVAIDTLNAGIHFPESTAASDIGYKALAVNLSDIAAMGGMPTWFTLALSMPEADEAWIQEFCAGMRELVTRYHLCLAGGDTTRGPLSVTVQIAGTVPVGKALVRSGARPGDDIYVTGTTGNAAAALLAIAGKIRIHEKDLTFFLQALNRPVPRIELALKMAGVVNSCIDISDGLIADLRHVCDASGVGARIDYSALPISSELRNLQLPEEHLLQLVTTGGDDYELCFTAPAEARDSIATVSHDQNIAVTCIGKITAEPGLFKIQEGNAVQVTDKGYEHF